MNIFQPPEKMSLDREKDGQIIILECGTGLMSFQRDAAFGILYFISLQDLSTCFGCSLNQLSGVLKTECATTGTSHRMW
jgi:hypothetical protein